MSFKITSESINLPWSILYSKLPSFWLIQNTKIIPHNLHACFALNGIFPSFLFSAQPPRDIQCGPGMSYFFARTADKVTFARTKSATTAQMLCRTNSGFLTGDGFFDKYISPSCSQKIVSQSQEGPLFDFSRSIDAKSDSLVLCTRKSFQYKSSFLIRINNGTDSH